jgi:hypothetical protein
MRELVTFFTQKEVLHSVVGEDAGNVKWKIGTFWSTVGAIDNFST